MSKKPSGLNAFITEHRDVLVRYLGEAGTREVTAILSSPLDSFVTLLTRYGLAPLARKLTGLIAGAGAAERQISEEAIRQAIQEVLVRSGRPVPVEVGQGAGAGHATRAKPPLAADETPPPPPPPSAPAPAPAPAAAPVTRGAPRHTARAKPPMRGGGLLGAERGAKPPTKKEEPEVRFLVAEIDDHEKDQPLTLEKHVLSVWIDVAKVGDAATRFLDAGMTHGRNEKSITLMVQVTSEDFTVSQKTALPLELPRRGPSDGKARFDVTPKATGRGALTISVHKEGNFLMQMELVYSTGVVEGAPVEKKVHGRSITSAAQLRKRDLGLTIKPVTGGYECQVRGSTYNTVILKIDQAKLSDAIQVARDAMLSVVKQREDGVAVFQSGDEFVVTEQKPTGSRVSAAAEQQALTTLAQAGGALFQALFGGKKAGKDEKAIGTLLKNAALSEDRRLTLQIVAENFPVPWGVLYFGSIAEGATLSWENFLGMRCIIEQIPLQTDMLVDDSTIASDKPRLAIGVNVNASIDEQFSLDVVKRQLDFWKKEAKAAGDRMTVESRTKRSDVLKALSGNAPDQLMYLYCHAVTNGPQDPGGITASHFVFTNDEELSLAQLDAEGAELPTLPGNPLVFINACESGELRPEFYDGFIPYFMARGARGVIGTECQTPAIFATEWALRFFPRFLGGDALGELFFDLRREFLDQHGNPLGLLYNVYCEGDTQVQPGLTL